MMNQVGEILMRHQMAKDTLWCLPCGLCGLMNKATLVYYVSSLDNKVLSCGECFAVAMSDGIDIVASKPVVQPEYISLLESIL